MRILAGGKSRRRHSHRTAWHGACTGCGGRALQFHIVHTGCPRTIVVGAVLHLDLRGQHLGLVLGVAHTHQVAVMHELHAVQGRVERAWAVTVCLAPGNVHHSPHGTCRARADMPDVRLYFRRCPSLQGGVAHFAGVQAAPRRTCGSWSTPPCTPDVHGGC